MIQELGGSENGTVVMYDSRAGWRWEFEVNKKTK